MVKRSVITCLILGIIAVGAYAAQTNYYWDFPTTVLEPTDRILVYKGYSMAGRDRNILGSQIAQIGWSAKFLNLSTASVSMSGGLRVSSNTVDGVNGLSSFFNPNMTNGQANFLAIGKAANSSQSGIFGYYYSSNINNGGLFLTNYGDYPGLDGIFVRKGGNVGVGTITPAEKVEIVGGTLKISTSSSSYLRLNRANTSHDNALTWQDNGIDKWYLGALPYGGPATAFHLFSADKTGGAGDVITVLAGGNVGIRTTFPEADFHVNGSTITNEITGGASVGTTLTIRGSSATGGVVMFTDLPTYGGATMSAANTAAKIAGLTSGAFFKYSTSGTRQPGIVW